MLVIHVEDWDDWYIELFENFTCDGKEELDKREGRVIREIGTIAHVMAKKN
jgi:hypothetical protein